jgi:hypothetical protein
MIAKRLGAENDFTGENRLVFSPERAREGHTSTKPQLTVLKIWP